MKDFSEDPVVYEADVKFATKRKGDFYLFQFSHNSSPFSIKKKCLGSIKTKPKLSQFEIELLMNTHSDTFDKDKSKRIAFNVDDSQKSNEQQQKELFFPNQLMSKQLLNSEKLASTGFQFALAYLRQDLDEVKLIPIKSVLEFKPAFHYMDKVKIKTSNKKEDSDEEDEEEFAAPTTNNNVKSEPETKKVTMRYEDKRRAASDNDTNQQNNLINENWVNVQYFDYGLPKFEKEKDVVLYKVNQDIEIEDNQTMDTNKFSYEEFARNNLDSSESTNKLQSEELKIDLLNTLPFYQTSLLPLKDQIRSILCSSKVISFNKCVHLLNLNIEKNRLADDVQNLDLQLVLKYLQQFGQLVQGNWVVKSEVIYPKSFNCSSSFDANSIPFTNISIDMLCKARDFVLYKFTKQECLSRLELIEKIRIPPDVISEILIQFSNFNKQTRSWHFVYPSDEEFINSYDEIVKKQEIIWEAQSNQLLNLFG